MFRRFANFKFILLLSLITHAIIVIKQAAPSIFSSFQGKQEEQPPKKELLRVRFQDVNKNKLQVVATEKAENLKLEKKAKFLSEHNQQVDRQTIARVVDKFNVGGGAGLGAKSKPVAKTSRSKSANGKGKFSLSDLAHKQIDEQFAKKMENVELVGVGKKGRGLSSNNDYVEDVPLGDMTLLNTTEYKFYGFYFRIRQQLEQYWGKSLKEKADNLYKSGRRLPASQDRITSLVIYLDHKGNIIEILVRSTSGVKELDDAAVESFNKAGPFPNPPKDMLVGGKVKIEWGFVVKS